MTTTAPAHAPRTTTRGPTAPEAVSTAATPAASGSMRRFLGMSLLGGLLLWLSFPPLNFGFLAWLAPVPWLMLSLRSELLARRHYIILGVGSALFWLALLQGVRLAHPALYAGWIVLSCYLAVYLPLSIASARLLIAYRWPAVIAVPVAWTAWDYVRAYFVTGFSPGSIGHTQCEYPLMIQIADLGGAYAVGFVMLTISTAVAIAIVRGRSRETLLSLSWGAILFCATLGYGWYRLLEPTSSDARSPLKVLLVQGSVDTVLDGDPRRATEMLDHYRSLTYEHFLTPRAYDLVVWPESSWALPDLLLDPAATAPPESGLSNEQFHEEVIKQREFYDQVMQTQARRLQGTSANTLFVAGASTWVYPAGGNFQLYNSALVVSPTGDVLARYHKQHLVMFGEYIPLGEWFPLIYRFVPIAGLQRGEHPIAFTCRDLRIAPSICFETTVPQLIRRHVNELAQKKAEPDMLLNTTNDGWFYGSSILDIHFQCAVFRAVENRKPLLIAANTGISAAINSRGEIMARAPKRVPKLLPIDVTVDGRYAPYRLWGDWPVCGCLVIVLGAIAKYSLRRS